MALPNKVAQQQDEANELWQQMYGQEDTRNPDSAESSSTTAAESDEAAPEDGEFTAAAGKENDAEYWRARANSLYGKVNHEIPRLNAEKRTLQDQAKADKARIQDLEQQLAQTQQQQPVNLADYFSQDEIDSYDPETLQKFAHLNQRLDHIEQGSSQGTSQDDTSQAADPEPESQRDQVIADLDRLLPGWRELEQDPNFQSWLGEMVDIETEHGRVPMRREQLLHQYADQGNSPDVYHLYRDFKERHTGGAQRPASRETPPRAADGGNTAAEPAMIPESEMMEFYRTYQSQLRRDPDATRAREREIDRAKAEGRIQIGA